MRSIIRMAIALAGFAAATSAQATQAPRLGSALALGSPVELVQYESREHRTYDHRPHADERRRTEMRRRAERQHRVETRRHAQRHRRAEWRLRHEHH